MDEFKFVLRSLVITAAIIFVSQYKFNNETLESKAQYIFADSQTAGTLREVAAGGVLFVRNAVEDGVTFIKRKMAHNDGGNRHEPRRNQSNY